MRVQNLVIPLTFISNIVQVARGMFWTVLVLFEAQLLLNYMTLGHLGHIILIPLFFKEFRPIQTRRVAHILNTEFNRL